MCGQKMGVAATFCVRALRAIVKKPLSEILATPLKQEILSPDGWLSDTVIRAAQLLILQEFSHIAGLQDPAVHQSFSFQILRGEFVQIIFVGGCHWCTVSGADLGLLQWWGCSSNARENLWATPT